MILCSDPRALYLARRAEIDAAIARVLSSGRYILGEEVEAFERELAAFCGARFGVGVASGTDALALALRAVGVVPGDEVITVSHGSVATVAAIEAAGATPVLVDIDPVSFTLEPGALEAAVTSRTRAVVPVHLYGHAADMTAIAAHLGLKVVEDCAQAHGARWAGQRVGSFGHAAAFSFYPTKNLGALGDGGMVLTSDESTAERLRLLRQYGWKPRNHSVAPGFNSRLDPLQAAVLRVKLSHLDEDNARRRALAANYSLALAGAGLTLPTTRPGAEHAFHLYVVRSTARPALQRALEAQGIEALIHYPEPIHLQPAYTRLKRGALVESERAAAEVLSLPLHPALSDADQATVIAAVLKGRG